MSYSVSFKDFYFNDSTLGEPKNHTVINGAVIKNGYKLSHQYPESVVKPTGIEFVYWTKQYGLTAYTNKAGETWLLSEK